MPVIVHVFVIAGGGVFGDEPPFGIEHPAMVWAGEGAGIAGAFPADFRTPMRAGIVEGGDLVVAVADEDEVAAANAAGREVALVLQLGAMAEIEPAFAEDELFSISKTSRLL